MERAEVKIGEVYTLRVGGRLCAVRFVRRVRQGGWYGENTATGRRVRIRQFSGPVAPPSITDEIPDYFDF